MNIITSLMIVLIFFAIVFLLICCKHVILPKCPAFLLAIVRKIEKKLFWNSLLRAILETFYF